jgi:putative spermidine/putrescine transport system ATP-binding protein/putrescine transport system ATP-binding protein
MNNVLELRNVVKRFGPITAVDDVSLFVEKATIISLLGPSGCGKTTLLRMVAGFEDPNAGEIYLGGENVIGRRPYERNVGLLFQSYALFPHMTVEKNVGYGLRQRGVDRSTTRKRVDEILDLVDMRGFAGRYPTNLSGGQQQRVALGRALANNPALVLLDEPLSALDAKLRLELRTELKRILKSAGTTAVVVTHDQEEAMTLGERVIVMNRGQVQQDGTPAEIYDRPKTRFVAEFIGRSNWFSGTVGNPSGQFTEFIAENGKPLLVQLPTGAARSDYDICVRPESVQVRSANSISSAAGPEPLNQLRGTVKDVIYLGASLETIVTLDNGREISAIEPKRHKQECEPGASVVVLFRPADAIVIGRS